uniref:Uncharacterized protein LOC104221486 n=1 Tax=Nicotiana sylvestris TaxID=4096 RepID=A0A1U7W9D0_NICSY|nr:PREDICTED: uncharacterized protein LOC104221486 [Nicotiana sylvestris]
MTSTRETFTIWMKSLVFHGNGCTVFNSKGEIVFKVDNYQETNSNEVFLVDLYGQVLFSIKKEKLRLFGRWNGYSSGGFKGKPWFQVRRNCKYFSSSGDVICNVNLRCEISIGSSYKIQQTDKKVYPSKWDKPTRVIAFIDIGTACSLMNHVVLPEDQWVSHFKDFNTASNGILTTTVITKHPVTIEFFPGFQYKTMLIGSDVPGKDLIVGFDIFKQLIDQLQIKANRITFKK